MSKLREMRKQMSAAQDERLRKAKALLERAKALQQASRQEADAVGGSRLDAGAYL